MLLVTAMFYPGQLESEWYNCFVYDHGRTDIVILYGFYLLENMV